MNESVKRAFSNRLKELRAEKNVNQMQLAEDLKIGRASISNYEIGSRLPDADVVVALADYFNVSTDYLLGRTNLRSETINGADEIMLSLSKQAETLSSARKDDLCRMLSCIKTMLSIDGKREDDYSIFAVYAKIIEMLRNLDETAQGYVSSFLGELADTKDDPKGINTTDNLINYYAMVDNVRNTALGIGESISHMLRTDAVLCLTGQREMLMGWGKDDLEERK